MPYDFSGLKKRIADVEEWFSQELSRVRTGRATPTLLDSVRVSSYGAMVPVNNIAGVTVEDAKTVRITPWEKDNIRAIEIAITDANLGISISVDDQGVRVIFPVLTSERRDALMKIVKNKHEESRISLRTARDETWEDIQKKERDGDVSEDDKFRLKYEMQKLVDEANKKLDEMVEKKEKEIFA